MILLIGRIRRVFMMSSRSAKLVRALEQSSGKGGRQAQPGLKCSGNTPPIWQALPRAGLATDTENESMDGSQINLADVLAQLAPTLSTALGMSASSSGREPHPQLTAASTSLPRLGFNPMSDKAQRVSSPSPLPISRAPSRVPSGVHSDQQNQLSSLTVSSRSKKPLSVMDPVFHTHNNSWSSNNNLPTLRALLVSFPLDPELN
ncbi:hypothetical protein PTTG_30003 [Puccinia triticina 1-1 BBBD Race 1]|uniref:Uncharacterized protein n=1 Tax=Puccinia triticina (isolate 1-1 / race 1 (BBBD)) TaxID=630390 RepID=A0A180G1C7_PUCT1|nr:hypothetical protein PTTG_30003 [Puccinia triticina 1-1 BBBD Race 1]